MDSQGRPPHSGPIHSLFQYLSTPNIIPHREPPAQPSHLQCLLPGAPIPHAAVLLIWGQHCLLSSLRVVLGEENGTECLQRSSQSALIVLTTCTAACTHWMRAHFSLRIRTKNYTYVPSKTKDALYSVGEHGMQTYEPHKTGPFCWASTTFSNTDNIIWMPSPVCHTAAWCYLVTCCSRHISCPDSFPMIFLPTTILARTVIMAGIDINRKNWQNRYLNSS